MNKLTIFAGAAVAAAVLATSAQASELLATWTENGVALASWKQAFAPTPENPVAGLYTQVPVWDYSDTYGASESSVYYFATSPYGGGWEDAINDFNVSGVQVYSGSESAPIFSSGIYAGTDSITGDAGALTLTAVPEPSAWALMLVGFGLTGSAARRHRRAAVA